MFTSFEKFKEQHIAIIGDIILDKYIFGKVERISPEAPVPIVRVIDEKYSPGGAANVAANISTLGGNAYLFGIVGNDQAKEILIGKTNDLNINTDGIITDKSKNTIKKTRVIGLNQQLLRIDYENTNYIESHLEKEFIDKLENIPQLSALIISDYAKGTITEELIKKIKVLSKKKNFLIIVDPKPKHKAWYKNTFLITPNKKEAEQMCHTEIQNQTDLENCGRQLSKELNCNVVITTGEKGMSIFEMNKKPIHLPTETKEVYDVSGAGDTVVASFGLALSSNASLEEAAILANRAAGIKVGKVGTAPVYLKELQGSFNENK